MQSKYKNKCTSGYLVFIPDDLLCIYICLLFVQKDIYEHTKKDLCFVALCTEHKRHRFTPPTLRTPPIPEQEEDEETDAVGA